MLTAGASRIVCLVKEDLETEVEDFRSRAWPGEVLLDEASAFYSALGGGSTHKPHSVFSFLAMIFNPFSSDPTKRHLKRAEGAGMEGNMKGDGFVTGGCYVIRRDGSAQYSFLEENIGDHAPLDDVIAAVQASADS